MSDGREVDQGELLGVAKDEERARSLLRALRTLSTGPDPKLRDMANGVLRGRLSAEQAFTDPEYTAALFSGADKVRRAGELRSDAEAREAGARFGEWQRARDAEQEREEETGPEGRQQQDGASAERPATHGGLGGTHGGLGSTHGLRGPEPLRGGPPRNRFGPR
ncbi:hypothetical protein [Streptomyces griseorubiginosus]|uniref:hypothetical protein n=1 Tax=Streptomyces griseorubiginosus TaxID=67304 RepID=UPI002E810667|nr:hypothetical protein [Streptomyces griseorubiginosus]WUB47366.1 hypothetical protein OHN19_30160 [Streptomyces griseorubiginosus]WUB55890.1 hypothetical protein OG942_30165 [Streptomyces griseorubiginosus]